MIVLLASLVLGNPLDDAQLCLDRQDVTCAEAALARFGATDRSVRALGLDAEIDFRAARYAEAAAKLARAAEQGWTPLWALAEEPPVQVAAATREVELYQSSAEVHADFVEIRRGRHVVRHRPGVDMILVEQAFETLELAERYLAPVLGGPPPGPVIVELYPDSAAFIACSGLPARSIRVTGVVALSKWGRLLVLSPAATARGYPWRHSLAHEYIHLVVSHHAAERAPLWVQEGLAKYLDARWRTGEDVWQLEPREQGLLAEALASDGLVSHELMGNSLALLPTPELASLAYAQLASQMRYLVEVSGEGAIAALVRRIGDGEAPEDVYTDLVGRRTYAGAMTAWEDWLRQRLSDTDDSELVPLVLAGGDDVATDPVLARRPDLAGYLRLGDLLLDAGRPKAALVEYERATPAGDARSPLVANRFAEAYLALEDPDRAFAALQSSLAQYPDYPLSYKTLGTVELARGRRAEAARAYTRAVEYNPFDLELQEALASLLDSLGDLPGAARHREHSRVLRRGGA